MAVLALLSVLLRLFTLQRRSSETTNMSGETAMFRWPHKDFQWTHGALAALLIILSAALVGLILFPNGLVQARLDAESPQKHLLVVSAAFAGLLFCFVVTILEVLRARAQNRLSFWLLFSNSILLTTMLALSFLDIQNTEARLAPVLVLAHACVGLLTLALGWVIALGWMADPNALSLHTFYKARLVRAYMGASNPNRHGQKAEITEAVEGDDVSLKEMNNCYRGAPYHLINTTLNLVGGRDLSTTQRASVMFLLSKRFCGSTRTLYRRSSEYMDGQLTLGAGVAVSGAAASPNMGALRTTAAQAMLLTLLNVRLGFWAPTPNGEKWRAPRARLWPFYMLREFLSQTNDLGKYCYLTDGGHFDNLGLYSLIERGCRFIVVSDATADPKPCFSDLGDAIRRSGIDFGAEINLNVEAMRRDEKTKQAATFVFGTITYSQKHLEALGWDSEKASVEKNRRGLIILIKPAMTEGVNADVRQYALENDSFPDQTTGDQFFDEAQFESYRRLGQFCAEQAFAPVLEEAANPEFQELLKRKISGEILPPDQERELERLLQFRRLINLFRPEGESTPALAYAPAPGPLDEHSPLDYKKIETIFEFLKSFAEKKARAE
jgi:hypothetical protein